MSVSQHRHADVNASGNQKNQMSDDPSDGARGPDSSTKQGKEQSQLEAFAEEGAGIAAKE
jgi:hypothetical protein